MSVDLFVLRPVPALPGRTIVNEGARCQLDIGTRRVPQAEDASVRTHSPDPDADDALEELLDRVGVVRIRLLDLEDNERLTPDGRDSLQAAFADLTRAYDLARIARVPDFPLREAA
jgi:hypothetical protein